VAAGTGFARTAAKPVIDLETDCDRRAAYGERVMFMVEEPGPGFAGLSLLQPG
jgi:hypothetical protein